MYIKISLKKNIYFLKRKSAYTKKLIILKTLFFMQENVIIYCTRIFGYLINFYFMRKSMISFFLCLWYFYFKKV